MSWWRRLLGMEVAVESEAAAEPVLNSELAPEPRPELMARPEVITGQMIEDKIRLLLAKKETLLLKSILENPDLLSQALPFEQHPSDYVTHEVWYHGEPRGLLFVPNSDYDAYADALEELFDMELVESGKSLAAHRDSQTHVMNGLMIWRIDSPDLLLEYPDWGHEYYVAYFGQDGVYELTKKLDWLRANLPVYSGAEPILSWTPESGVRGGTK